MALFKILRGLQENLESNAARVDGQILVCTDTGKIYVDFLEGEEIERIQLAKYPTILSGTTEPDDSIGDVGDIYIQLAEEG